MPVLVTCNFWSTHSHSLVRVSYSHVQLPVHCQVWATACHPGVPESRSQLWVSIITEVLFTTAGVLLVKAVWLLPAVGPQLCAVESRGPGGPTCPAWAVNISLGIYSDCVGVWGGWQLVIGWATDIQWSGDYISNRVCTYNMKPVSGEEVFQRCTYTDGAMGEVDSSSLWCTRDIVVAEKLH